MLVKVETEMQEGGYAAEESELAAAISLWK